MPKDDLNLVLRDFDIVKYLDSRNIWHKDHGDNVSNGWTSINCLFCIDHSNHLGINLTSKVYTCYKCAEEGNCFKLIQEIDGVTFRNAIGIAKEFGNGVFIPRERHFQTKLKLPDNILKELTPRHKEFLINRRYDPDYVIPKYKLLATGPVGNFKHRIIIPVHMNERMLSFIGRDVTGQATIPYKNSPESLCIKDPKNSLYNMDSVLQSKAVVVEGIFDAWRIGDGAVATFGTKYTHEQLRLFKNLKRVFVLYDADAKTLSHKLAADLSSIVKEVKVLELDEGDPDNLTDDDVRSLRREIGL
jgi:DNA primase